MSALKCITIMYRLKVISDSKYCRWCEIYHRLKFVAKTQFLSQFYLKLKIDEKIEKKRKEKTDERKERKIFGRGKKN